MFIVFYRVSRKKGTLFGRLMFLIAVTVVVANCLVTVLLTKSSIANYPGGSAMALLNQLYADDDRGKLR